jgi:hypothetical protein
LAFHVPEKFRVHLKGYPILDDYGNNGAFICKVKHGQLLKVIASEGEGWQHVSVSRTDRCPTWEEMCQIKDLFWDDTDCVVQYHPPKSDYVSNHPYCLHLWKPIGSELPRPDSIFVGYVGMSETEAKRLVEGVMK